MQAFSTFGELDGCKQDLLIETIYGQTTKPKPSERILSPSPDAEMV